MSAGRARRALKAAALAVMVLAASLQGGCAPAAGVGTPSGGSAVVGGGGDAADGKTRGAADSPAPAEDGAAALIRNGAATAASATPASSAASDRATGAGTSASVRPAETSAGTPSPTSSPSAKGRGAVGASSAASAPGAPGASGASPPAEDGRVRPSATVELSVVGDDARGVILAPVRVPLEAETETALDVLLRAARDRGITVKYRGRGRTAYIEAIDGLGEFDRGPMSGWLYRVDGVFPSVGAGAYFVRPGDRIEFVYTTDGGRDVRGAAP